MPTAPIVLFVYNRPLHTRQTVEALKKNELASESDLIIYSDGPKTDQDVSKVSEVREYLRQITGFRSIRIHENNKNYGLANSVILGVSDTVNEYGKVIVLEDDLVTSPFFLRYMNTALERYDDEKKVMQISGYMFPVEFDSDLKAFFLSFTSSWGWATWKRAWSHFDPDAAGYQLLRENDDLKKTFDLGGAYPYFRMLESQLRGEIDSWAIRWYLSVFVNNGLVLYPLKTLVLNNGFDGSGTHCCFCYEETSKLQEGRVDSWPASVCTTAEVQIKIINYLRTFSRNRMPIRKKIFLERILAFVVRISGI